MEADPKLELELRVLTMGLSTPEAGVIAGRMPPSILAPAMPRLLLIGVELRLEKGERAGDVLLR